MTKQEILNLIDTTIKPNNKKAISAQSLQNVLREMAEASGSGSGSGSGSDGVLYIKEPSSGELSEEDRAINAATFAKLKAGGSYTVYLDYDDLLIPISYGLYPLEDGTYEVSILTEGIILKMMGISASIGALLEDGSIRSDMMLPDSGRMITKGELLANIMDFATYAQMFGVYPFYLLGDATSVVYDPAELIPVDDGLVLNLTSPKQNSLYKWYYGAENFELIYILSGGTLYLDADSDLEKNNNKMVLESLVDLGNAKFNCMTGTSTINAKIYNPVSIDQANHQVTIYNGAYVTYTINSDGTCTVQS